jgi:hypothetical protein
MGMDEHQQYLAEFQDKPEPKPEPPRWWVFIACLPFCLICGFVGWNIPPDQPQRFQRLGICVLFGAMACIQLIRLLRHSRSSA